MIGRKNMLMIPSTTARIIDAVSVMPTPGMRCAAIKIAMMVMARCMSVIEKRLWM
jgi:hypothetical protein